MTHLLAHVFMFALLASSTAAAAEDAPPTHLRGTITARVGSAFTLTAGDGAKTKLSLLPEATIMVATQASLVDVTPGTPVGIANTGPNGLQDALEVHIFPDALRGRDEGQSRWDLSRRSRMTIGRARAKAISYDGQNLTVTFNGDESTIQVRPNTPVVRLTPGAPGDLKVGTSLFVRDGEAQPDGSIAAGWLVVGRDGLKPPM